MHRAENKSNKVVVLATYGVAVLCLLLGLLLPLFNGKEVLALKLGDVFKSLLKKDSEFGLAYPIALFGLGKSFDISALFIVLYTVVTVLAVLAVIPVTLSVRKEGKLAKKLYYGVEIAAVIVISLYFVSVIFVYGFEFKDAIGYNLVIAGVGTLVALLALTGLDKGKKATVKIVLSVLSLIAFLALIDVLGLKITEENLAKLYDKKLATGLSSGGRGIDYLNAFFAAKLTDTLKLFEGKDKILYLVSAIASTVVLLNFIIDTIKLAIRKYKKRSIIFDIVRYGVEIVLAVLVLVVTLICKHYIGLMLIAILVASAVQLTIVIVKYVSALRRKAARSVKEDEVAVEDTYAYKAAEPILLADGSTEPVIDEQPVETVDEQPVEEYEFKEAAEEVAETEAVSESEPTTPVPPVPDEDGYVDPELDAQYQQQLLETKAAEDNISEIEDEDLEDVELYEPGPDATYLTNTDAPVEETEPAEEVEQIEEPYEEVAEEAAEEAEPVEQPAEEAEQVEEPAEEPVEAVEEVAAVESEETEPVEEVEEPAEAVEEVAAVESEETEPIEEVEKPVEEPVEEVAAVESEETEPVEEVEEPVEEQIENDLEEPVQNPFREVKPYNPYERHNNPFKQFEEPPQTYNNPYRQQQPVQYEKPQPARPAYEPKRYEQPERPVRPLQPRPIIQEFKPVPPVSEQPPKESRIYTIDTLYAGPIDDFIRKLSNDERIEFAKTFLEKNRGSLGSIPDYVVGGDNKKFFSATFIYLGRIRGMVSDGLLNKMYKEINLL